MKNFLHGIFLLFAISLLSCNSSKMGRAHYSKDGSIQSGIAKTKCTHPSKRYTKSLDAKVKASIDSITQLSNKSIDIQVAQTVTRLSDYTSEGLDLDLILFRICEISINKGFTKDQTDHLIQIAMDSWSKKGQSITTITNNGINNGVMAETVIVPDSKEIPLANNFIITPVTDTLFTHAIGYKNKFIFEIKPKQGVWYNPFIAYPIQEDSLVQGDFHPKALSYSMMGGGGTATIKLKNGNVLNLKTLNINKVSNSFIGNIFTCNEKPSLLVFGDSDNPTKQYIVSLNKN